MLFFQLFLPQGFIHSVTRLFRNRRQRQFLRIFLRVPWTAQRSWEERRREERRGEGGRGRKGMRTAKPTPALEPVAPPTLSPLPPSFRQVPRDLHVRVHRNWFQRRVVNTSGVRRRVLEFFSEASGHTRVLMPQLSCPVRVMRNLKIHHQNRRTKCGLTLTRRTPCSRALSLELDHLPPVWFTTYSDRRRRRLGLEFIPSSAKSLRL